MNFGPPLNAPPIKFRTQSTNLQQPKPILIPLHHDGGGQKTLPQQSSSSGQLLHHPNHHPHYTNFNQFRLKQQQTVTNHQNPQFQQPFQQPTRVHNQNVGDPNNHRFILSPSQSQSHTKPNSHGSVVNSPASSNQNNKILFQQTHLVQNTPPSTPPSNLQKPFTGDSQDINRFVSGAELVESLPKFEQHITETVPLSEINKPFSPFRQLTSSVHSTTGVRTDTSQQAKNSFYIQEQQQKQQYIHEDKQELSSREHRKTSSSPLKHIQTQQKQVQHDQQETVHFNSPQIVLPINYQTKSHQMQDQKIFNSLSSSSNYVPTPVFHEKVILGKGVSNLATDVFGELNNKPHIDSNNQVSAPDSHVQHLTKSITEENFVTTNHTPLSTRKVNRVPSVAVQPTTTPSRKTTKTTVKPKSQKVQANLPDEVPDDLRQQLLSSGILENADISILDYDKVGDIPFENLPAEHLANFQNFYGADGAAQISSSNRVLNIVKPNGDSVVGLHNSQDEKSEVKKTKTLPKKHNVDLKVVRFDSTNQKSIADKYIKSDSTVLPSVDINPLTSINYNR